MLLNNRLIFQEKRSFKVLNGTFVWKKNKNCSVSGRLAMLYFAASELIKCAVPGVLQGFPPCSHAVTYRGHHARLNLQ